jgi:pentatricopeptide repeat protein
MVVVGWMQHLSSGSENDATMKRSINLKAILILLLSSVAVGVGTHFVHALQMKRNAGQLLEEATQAEADGHTDVAIATLRVYLELNPTDNDALIRYGLLLSKAATSTGARTRAFLALEKAFRADRTRKDVRREIVINALALGRYTDAKEHLGVLREAFPDETEPEDPHERERLLAKLEGLAEIEGLTGQCEEGNKQYDAAVTSYENAIAAGHKQVERYLKLAKEEEGKNHDAEAEECYRKAIQHARTQIDNYVKLALLRRLHLPQTDSADKKTDQTIEDMLLANPSPDHALGLSKAARAAQLSRSLAAHLEAARYYSHFQLRDEALRVAQDALDNLEATDPDFFLLAAGIEQRQKHDDRACQRLEAGLRANPDDNRLTLALAALEVKQGKTTEALAHVKRLLDTPPEQPEELFQLASLLVDMKDLDKARALIERLRQQRVPAVADLLSAGILIEKQRWGEARQLLETLLPQLVRWPTWGQHANLLLAQCYAHLDNPDQELVACRRAVLLDRTSPPAQAALAAALTKLGRWEEAFDVYQNMIQEGKRSDDGPSVEDITALAHVLAMLNPPPADRRWAVVNKELDNLPVMSGSRPDVLMAKAELKLAGNHLDDARELLAKACADASEPLEPWLRLASLENRARGPEQALAVVENAEKKLGKRWELEQARIRLVAQKKDGAADLSAIQPTLEKWQPVEKARLLFALAEAFNSLGNVDKAVRIWEQLAEADPAGLNVRLLLFDAADRAGQEAEMERWLREIKQIEGEGGPLWSYGEGARLVYRAEQGDKSVLATAHQRAAEAAGQRPSWSNATILEGRIFDLEDNADKALEKYLRGLGQGASQAAVVVQAVKLLTKKSRFGEAWALLAKRPDVVKTIGNSGKYQDCLWLANRAWEADKRADAETWFRKAVKLNDQTAETWRALLLFLAVTEPKKTDDEIEEARRRLPSAQMPLALAPAYAELGRVKDAKKMYDEALKAQPDDPALLQFAGAFFTDVPGQQAKAEECFKKLRDPTSKATDDVRASATRQLASLLARSGSFQRNQEARALLQNSDSLEDRRALALVMARSPQSRKEAIAQLESLAKGRTPTPEERFQLVLLYVAEGRLAEARSQMLSLFSQSKNPDYLARYALAILLRKDVDVDSAEDWVNRLAELEPQSLRTLLLQAVVLHQRGKTEDAVRLLEKGARDEDKVEQLPGRAATLVDIGRPDRAEELYRDYKAKSKKPDAVLLLAKHLGGQKQVNEALALCDQAWKTCVPEAVIAATLTVLRTGLAKEAQFADVERHLDEALSKAPTPSLMVAKAELHELQGRYDAAIADYRDLLARAPESVEALNNLGWLLALKAGNAAEGLELLNKAIAIAGADANFLDTRGVIHLALHDHASAIQDLEEASRKMPTASVYFHLAQARHAAQDDPAARLALAEAQRLRLSPAALHPLERNAYQPLLTELGAN